MPKRTSYVYIVASHSRVLYIGVTNDLERRVSEHRQKLVRGFTAMYNVTRLVYFEEFDRISEAIAREKELKNWSRAKKISLIEQLNPEWEDLSVDAPSKA
jgi:putative endonuclease